MGLAIPGPFLLEDEGRGEGRRRARKEKLKKLHSDPQARFLGSWFFTSVVV